LEDASGAESEAEMSDSEPTRLFLVTPAQADAATLMPRLREALAAGSVAAVLIADGPSDALEGLAKALVPVIQQAGAAALVGGDTRIAGHAKADGVQMDGPIEDLRFAVESFRPARIVGAGNLASRHAAMEAGEIGPDYLFFGQPHGDTHDDPHPKALDLAEWWSELMQIPAVVMAGRSLDSVAAAAATGAAFVALNEAVWSHAGGAGAAVRQAQTALERAGRRAA
jgi:thiamine-phosphate pyrophosphorylase